MIFVKILAIVTAFISAIFYFLSSIVKLPEAPERGHKVEARPFQDLFNKLNKMSRLNAIGGICLFISLFLQSFTLIIEVLNK